jgi:DNA-binding HxlR family transcriptional regulator
MMLKPHDPRRCPVDQALEMVSGKWKTTILWRLSAGRLRHSELGRALPGVTQRMLTLHLRELEHDGLVRRSVFPELPPRVEYNLTTLARGMIPLLEGFGSWWLGAHAEADAVADEPAAAASTPASNVRIFRIGR